MEIKPCNDDHELSASPRRPVSETCSTLGFTAENKNRVFTKTCKKLHCSRLNLGILQVRFCKAQPQNTKPEPTEREGPGAVATDPQPQDPVLNVAWWCLGCFVQYGLYMYSTVAVVHYQPCYIRCIQPVFAVSHFNHCDYASEIFATVVLVGYICAALAIPILYFYPVYLFLV